MINPQLVLPVINLFHETRITEEAYYKSLKLAEQIFEPKQIDAVMTTLQKPYIARKLQERTRIISEKDKKEQS